MLLWLFGIDKFDVHGSLHRKPIFKYNQQDAPLHNLFISLKCSTCFRHFTQINKLCNVACCWLYLKIQHTMYFFFYSEIEATLFGMYD